MHYFTQQIERGFVGIFANLYESSGVICGWDQQTNFVLALQILTHELISAGHVK